MNKKEIKKAEQILKNLTVDNTDNYQVCSQNGKIEIVDMESGKKYFLSGKKTKSSHGQDISLNYNYGNEFVDGYALGVLCAHRKINSNSQIGVDNFKAFLSDNCEFIKRVDYDTDIGGVWLDCNGFKFDLSNGFGDGSFSVKIFKCDSEYPLYFKYLENQSKNFTFSDAIKIYSSGSLIIKIKLGEKYFVVGVEGNIYVIGY